MTISKSILTQLRELSSKSGVYLFRDLLGKVIYVGKAKSLNKRVRSYFQPARFNQLPPRIKALVETVQSIETFVVKNEPEALLLEGKLIKQYKPKYNIAFRDDKRFLMVKLTRDPFPKFVLTRLQKPDGCRYFGPFSNSGALRNTLDYILENFHIRSCRPLEPDEKDYKHCMNDILRHCSAPCVQRVSQEEYGRWVERACLFLEGFDGAVLEKVEADMMRASAKHDFERAASLRDTLYDLRTTVKQSARKFIRDMPRVCDPKAELEDLKEALGLNRLPRCIEGFDVSHIHGRHTVGSMVQFLEGRPFKQNYRHFTVKGQEGVQGNDDFASMRQIVGRRYKRQLKENRALPDLVLIDGGRGQLNYALLALKEAGVQLQMVGLAKEDEEIYVPGRDMPLCLQRNSPALHLLQRIRDESHRFANTLHHSWRKKQIRESMLDEIPGLGSARKEALLKHFGSLKRLLEASVEEIAKVNGVGEKSAELVLNYLRPKD